MNNEKQVAEKLPIIFNEGNEIVFNKAAVRFEGIEPQKIEQDIKIAQDFLSSDPDLSDKIQYKQLVALQSLLRGHRTGIDKRRKGLGQIFRDATTYINGKAKEIIGPAQEVENQLKELRNAHEAEIERRAQEEARKEEERINKIESRIEFIRDLPSECIGKSTKIIANYAKELIGYQEDFQEFEEVGSSVKEKALKQLDKLYESALAEEERAERERIAEEERKQREAEERAEFERQQKELAIQQEAAEITASVVNFINAPVDAIEKEIARLSGFLHPANGLKDAAEDAIRILDTMLPVATRREELEQQAAEQEAERKRIEAERQAEEQRKAEEEAREKAKQERAEKETQEVAERKRLAEEAECRKAEDFGQTVAVLSDLIGVFVYPETESPENIAETVAEAIQDGEIPFVFWSNER